MARAVFFKTFILLAMWVCLSKATEENEVCFGELKCFNSKPPFNADMPLPFGPKRLGTKFYLHTRTNREQGYFLEAKEKNILSSGFNSNLKTKIIIHGFVISNTELASWVSKVADAILDKEDVNVIVVNWVNGARVTYDQAVSNTRVVGAQVGYLIKNLMEYSGASTEDFHIIGFSLGAHVAGFAGKSVKLANNNKAVARITGLDPANPGFDYDNGIVRLDKSDADFVDIIHTDTTTLLFKASGISRNIGHADFYPNGGASQPGCSGDMANDNTTWFSSVAELTVCDHLRAPRLFLNSINMTDKCSFTSYRCASYEKFKEGKCIRCSNGDNRHNRCNVMGYWAEKPRSKKQVQYYLQTTAKAPFCVKNYQVQFHWRKAEDVSTAEGFKAKLFVTLKGTKGSTAETALNDGTTYHIKAGEATRFMVTVGCEQDIGQVQEVVFRWERPKCWLWFFCSTENIYLRRIKIIDSALQKQFRFNPVNGRPMTASRRKVVEILPNVTFEFLKKSTPKRKNLFSNEATTNQIIIPMLSQVEPNSRRNIQHRRQQHKASKISQAISSKSNQINADNINNNEQSNANT